MSNALPRNLKPENLTRTLADGSIEITLTRGKVAVIDAAAWGVVRHYRWSALECRPGRWYARAHVVGGGGKVVYMHALLCPCPPGLWVDHADGDSLNNRQSNLRPATASQNAMNLAGRSNRKSRFKGVCYRGGRRKPWFVQLRSGGRNVYVGYYHTEEEAANAYDAAAREHFGEFAYRSRPAGGSDAAA
jgi:hypothetical protein